MFQLPPREAIQPNQKYRFHLHGYHLKGESIETKRFARLSENVTASQKQKQDVIVLLVLLMTHSTVSARDPVLASHTFKLSLLVLSYNITACEGTSPQIFCSAVTMRIDSTPRRPCCWTTISSDARLARLCFCVSTTLPVKLSASKVCMRHTPFLFPAY